MTDELLPCPFCDNPDAKIRWDENFEGECIYFADCPNCSGSGPERLTRRAAIAAWNQRPTVAVPDAEPDAGEGEAS